VQNRWVQFKIDDIYIPEPAKIYRQLRGEPLRGKVVELCSSGPQEKVFAVVEVEGLRERVIIPVDCVKEIR